VRAVLRVVLLAVVVLLVPAAPAPAAGVFLNVFGEPSIPSGTLAIEAAAGEANDITLVDSSTKDLLSFTVTDPHGGLTAAGECTAQPDGKSVQCSHASQDISRTVRITLGDGNDKLDLRGAAGATVDAGPGADVVIGSPESDDIFGGTGRDRLSGGKGDDVIDGRDDTAVSCGAGRDLQIVHAGVRLGSSCEDAGDAGRNVIVRAKPRSVRAGVATFDVTCQGRCPGVRLVLVGYGRSAKTTIRSERTVRMRVPLTHTPRPGARVRLRIAAVDVKLAWPR
jgi:hypothetical protein